MYYVYSYFADDPSVLSIIKPLVLELKKHQRYQNKNMVQFEKYLAQFDQYTLKEKETTIRDFVNASPLSLNYPPSFPQICRNKKYLLRIGEIFLKIREKINSGLSTEAVDIIL